MTWLGEGSGVVIFSTDGGPAELVGSSGQYLKWENGPMFSSVSAGGGDFSTNTSTSVANEIVLFSDTSGKIGKRATQDGVAHLANGVLTGSNVLESEITLSDNTTNNVTMNKHGFTPKASGYGYHLGGSGTWMLGAPNVYSLISDQAASTTGLNRVWELDHRAEAGTYMFQYFIRYQSATTSVGVRFSVNYTGTTTAFLANMRWVDASATASTAAADQDNIQAAGAVMGSFSARRKSVLGWGGTTISVDTINEDMLMIIEGLAVTSTTGNFELWHGSDTATSTTVKAGTSYIITRTR